MTSHHAMTRHHGRGEKSQGSTEGSPQPFLDLTPLPTVPYPRTPKSMEAHNRLQGGKGAPLACGEGAGDLRP
eukprot:CAMPEP_0185443572 /NCGR_PEP_ID=MMETSP1365-20130426/47541_1 /TAXON_ID=38817 /ORGANISM="Gephyrocapsa oceanica, Strain RCC1303" /LENGTH=71 /DNA_ID=CAMNT_0028049191 /DNA_START=91 /DNA_END=302 /DNA_ORIENTATION=-